MTFVLCTLSGFIFFCSCSAASFSSSFCLSFASTKFAHVFLLTFFESSIRRKIMRWIHYLRRMEFPFLRLNFRTNTQHTAVELAVCVFFFLNIYYVMILVDQKYVINNGVPNTKILFHPCRLCVFFVIVTLQLAWNCFFRLSFHWKPNANTHKMFGAHSLNMQCRHILWKCGKSLNKYIVRDECCVHIVRQHHILRNIPLWIKHRAANIEPTEYKKVFSSAARAVAKTALLPTCVWMGMIQMSDI